MDSISTGGRSRKRAIRIAIATGTACVLGFALSGLPGRAQPGPPPQADMVVDAATRNAVIEGVISNLRRNYVFPEMAARLEKMLRVQVQQGAYDSVTSAEKLAQGLTAALQRESGDRHLEVGYVAQTIPERAPDADGTPEEKAEEQRKQQRLNYGFASVGRLKGNVGIIDLHQFSRPQGAAPRIAAAMALLADTQALIVDLRHCGGGDPETVMLFASYLYDGRTHLNDIYWRDENRTEVRWTTDTVPGIRYGQARKLYLLTSRETFSGCEDFAYALKNNHRATLIGETTGGGAHAGSPQRLDAHFMMFVPTGRPINPVTHGDWEGVGVAPDVKTSADDAQNIAHVAALKALIAVERDAEWRGRLQQTVDELE